MRRKLNEGRRVRAGQLSPTEPVVADFSGLPVVPVPVGGAFQPKLDNLLDYWSVTRDFVLAYFSVAQRRPGRDVRLLPKVTLRIEDPDLVIGLAQQQ